MSRLLLSLVALLGCAVTALAQNYDAIYLHEGGRKQGHIVEMSKDNVVLDIAGAKIPVDVGDIKRITFSDAPGELITAQTSIASGQFESAIDSLKRIDRADIQRKIVEDEVDYYIAFAKAKVALAGASTLQETNEATGAMAKLAANTGSYHYYEANEITGDLAMAIGRADKAAEFYAKVGQAKWDAYKMRAFVLQGQALMAMGKYQDALSKFDPVIGYSSNTPLASRQKDFATIGRALCLAKDGKADEGLKAAEKIIAQRDSRDGELFGRAYNALGGCYLAANKPDLALLAYLHVHLLFYQNASQHAEALYHLSSLWRDVRQDPTRAIDAANLLKQRYPNSVWTRKASGG